MFNMKKTVSKSKVKDNGDGIIKKSISTAINSSPTEEEIREKAKEIYLQRIDRGENGNAEEDWLEAEKYLSNLQE
jgi:hypothetical protein